MIKQAVKVGNSAGVILPKEWLNGIVEVKLVRPPINEKEILKDLMEYLQDYLPNILGIYLIGSYSREDYDLESDVDILVITDNINKSIKKGNYEIILISKDIIDKNLSKRLYLLSMIKEAKPILNRNLLEKYKQTKSKINIKKHKKEIKNILKINKDSIEFAKDYDKKILDGTAYSIVLRLREIYLLKCIINNDQPNKKELLEKIPKSVYEGYLRVKRNKKQKDDISIKDTEKLYNLSEIWLKELKD